MAKNLSSADCCAAKAAATTVATIIKSFDYEDWDDIEALEVINVFLKNNFCYSITDVLIGEDRCAYLPVKEAEFYSFIYYRIEELTPDKYREEFLSALRDWAKNEVIWYAVGYGHKMDWLNGAIGWYHQRKLAFAQSLFDELKEK